MNKSRLIKIIVPVLIVAVIAAIWIVKNQNDAAAANDDTKGGTSSSTSSGSALETKTELEIASVDMAELKSQGLPIIIDFGSDSCIPCKAMAPVLEKMHKEMQGKAIIHFVDVWKHVGAGDDFPLRAIPTQVFFTADGKPYTPSEEIQKTIEFTPYSSKETSEHIFTIHEGGLTEEEFGAILVDMGVK